MDKNFLQSKDVEIRELKSLAPHSKEYKKKLQLFKAQMAPRVFKDFNQSTKGDFIYPYRKKHRANLLFCAIFAVAAFVLLGFSIAALGDKEPEAFTSAEMQQFILWMGSIFLSLCAAMFFAIRAGNVVSRYLQLVLKNYEEEV